MPLHLRSRTVIALGVITTCFVVLIISGYQIAAMKASQVKEPPPLTLPSFSISVPDGWLSRTESMTGNSVSTWQKTCDTLPAISCMAARYTYSTAGYSLGKDCAGQTEEVCLSHMPSGAFMTMTLMYRGTTTALAGQPTTQMLAGKPATQWPAPPCTVCTHSQSYSFSPRKGYTFDISLRAFSNPDSPLTVEQEQSYSAALEKMLASLTLGE